MSTKSNSELSATYPPLAQLQTTLIPAVLKQLHSTLLEGCVASDFTNDLTHKLHMLAKFLIKRKEK